MADGHFSLHFYCSRLLASQSRKKLSTMTNQTLQSSVQTFVETKIIPAEPLYEAHIAKFTHQERWSHAAVPPILNQLKSQAQQLGLWNLFLPHSLPPELLQLNATKQPHIPIQPTTLLTNRQYAPLAEVMGSSPIASEIFNCSAPDTGNMEVLLKFGSTHQQQKYLLPLLRGEMRSAFLMTEPQVASSDARNLETVLSPHPDGLGYVLNGRKWWSTGVMDPRCQMVIIVAKTDPSLLKMKNVPGGQSIVVLPLPYPGISLIRPLTVFGYDDAPHGHAEVELINVHVKEEDVVLGLGRGFEIAQERLGPGRIHHCEYLDR
jgi:acyl-CoA dehydrogenase